MNCPICQASNPDVATVCAACGALLQPATGAAIPLAVGTPLREGAYIIESMLGQGGFGITYRATDARQQCTIAIKEFFPIECHRQGRAVEPQQAGAADAFQAAKTKFLQESNILSNFHHPSIVRVHESFEENDTAYMVMEYLEGRPLSAVLQEHSGRLGEGEAIAYAERVGEALEIVHHAGLLHRDVKPDNIMVCRNGRVELIDFGTARDMAISQTQGHTVVVTHGYAPLEQYAKHAQRGVTTDIYALAATLYHLLTGHIPASAIDRANGVALRPPCELRPELSRPVNDAIMWAMQLKVADRPQGVRRFLDALWEDPLSRKKAEPKRQHEEMTSSEANASIVVLDGYRKITVADSEISWPHICACCGARATTHIALYAKRESPAEAARGTWMVPYCSDCESHISKAPRMREEGRFIGILLSTGILSISIASLLSHTGGTYAGVLISVPMALAFIAFPMLLFIAGLGLAFLVESSMPLNPIKPACASERLAVEHAGHNANKQTFLFWNPEYAEQFYDLNTAKLAGSSTRQHDSK
jgi:serine/threonine protein kinase